MIIIRVDDVGWGTEKVTDRGMREYEKFHKIFADRQIPYVAGIIPAQFDNEMMGWLKENHYPGMSIFLHGWSHVIYDNNKQVTTEFRTLSPDEQRRRMLLGLDKFKDYSPKGFIPPFNSYDLKTLLIAKELGFKYFLVGAEVRSGRVTPKLSVYKEEPGFYIIPEQWDLYCTGDYNKMLEVTEKVKTIPFKPYPQILSLHCVWEYPNLNTGALEKLLDAAKPRISDIRNFNGIPEERKYL